MISTEYKNFILYLLQLQAIFKKNNSQLDSLNTLTCGSQFETGEFKQ